MLVETIESTKPTIPSAATCQRPGTSCRFIPSTMKPVISATRISIHNVLLVNRNGLPRFPAIG